MSDNAHQPKKTSHLGKGVFHQINPWFILSLTGMELLKKHFSTSSKDLNLGHLVTPRYSVHGSVKV